MKFFLSQMETSKEAIRVGTLTLIRAVVGADGEQGPEGGSPRGLDPRHFLFCGPTGWAKEPVHAATSRFLP